MKYFFLNNNMNRNKGANFKPKGAIFKTECKKALFHIFVTMQFSSSLINFFPCKTGLFFD